METKKLSHPSVFICKDSKTNSAEVKSLQAGPHCAIRPCCDTLCMARRFIIARLAKGKSYY